MAPPKYKWSFSLFHLTEETSKEISRIQGISKGFFAIVTTSTYLTANSDYALLAAIAAVAVDTVLSCFYVEKIK